MRRVALLAGLLTAILAVGTAAAVVAVARTGETADAPRSLVVVAAGGAVETTEPVPTTTASTTIPPTTARPPARLSTTTTRAVADTAEPTAAGTRPPAIAPPSPPAGTEPFGYKDLGLARSVTSGGTTGRLEIYKSETYPDQTISFYLRAEVTGAIKSARIEFGDGSAFDATQRFEGCWAPPKTHSLYVINGTQHLYATPGTHTVTARLTTVDCVPPPDFPLVHEMIPFMADGAPTPRGEYAPMGEETTVTVTLPVVVRSDPAP